MKDLKLHLACGTVYLKDYINIDAVGYYKQVRPDLLEENITTFDNYYKDVVTPKDFMSYKFKRREVVVDLIGDITDLGNIFMGSDFGIAKNSVSEIVAIQVLEHFTFEEASKVLENWRKYMKLGASIRIHVPDILGIIREFNASGMRDNDVDWLIRQIYGSQRNDYNVHKSGWTFDSLRDVMFDTGFRDIERVKNIHTYPAICITAKK